MFFIFLSRIVGIPAIKSVRSMKQQVEDAKAIGKIIQKVRRSQGIDQASFSMLCGFSLAPVKDIEAGRGSPSIDKLLTMLNELGIKVHLEVDDD